MTYWTTGVAFRRGVPFDNLLPVALGFGVYLAVGLIMLLGRDKPKEPKESKHSA